jgi:hypothetical protein
MTKMGDAKFVTPDGFCKSAIDRIGYLRRNVR